MNEGFDKLIEIGAQKIHEATHIARAHVQAILDENFEHLNSIQFSGFISILEREYNIDLSELRHDGMTYFNAKTPEVKVDNKVKVFVHSKKKGNLNILYLVIGVLVFIVFTFMSQSTNSSENSDVVIVDNSAIDSAQTYISSDINNTVVEQEQEIQLLKITATNEVWLGYIDLDTSDKKQTTITNEFTLDPSKNWLLVFGHGQINIEVNGDVQEYTSSRTARFSYINGELKKIRLDEFKRLNRGSAW